MKKHYILFGILTANFLITACSTTPESYRTISSETARYFISSDEAQKRIKELKATPLSDGQCFADPDAKIYLTNVRQSAPTHYRDLKEQINVTKMENTSSTEFYFCRVTCLLNDRYAAFWTTLTDAPARHNNDNGFVCQGVSIEMVKIPGTSLSALGAVVHNFSAFEINELLPRLKEVNYKLSATTKAELDRKANASLAIVARAYMTSTMPAMIEAGFIMDQIAGQKQGHQAHLAKYVEMLKSNNGKLGNEFNTDYFVMLNLLQHARHFLYN